MSYDCTNTNTTVLLLCCAVFRLHQNFTWGLGIRVPWWPGPGHCSHHNGPVRTPVTMAGDTGIMSLTGGIKDLLQKVNVICPIKYFLNFYRIFSYHSVAHSGACHVSGVKGYGYSELISSYKDNTAKYSRTEAETGGPSVSITSLLYHHCCVRSVSVSFFWNNNVS